uniref:NADH-ubiquinone oxidoreductase chain 3 n=1 Tax=Prostomis sp. PRO01 TaxID=1205644 RepID=A0A0S2MQ36_9CUCU|nr:NADH deshydrogenase subunit 3 [Prostomis sp. PRO01]
MIFMLSNLAMLILIINFILIAVINLLTKKSIKDREKSSPFECGFDPKSTARLSFSLHFFLVALIFLIFDVEITLLLPFIITMKYSKMISYFSTLTFFIAILLVGLFHEWKQGALNWVY